MIVALSCLTKRIDERTADFLRYHRKIGVDRIHLYVDGPPEGTEEAPGGCTVTFCDESFWRDWGRLDCHALENRQRAVMAAARSRAAGEGAHFYTHIDSDELIYAPRGLKEVLAALPPSAMSVRLPPLEAVATRRQCGAGLYGATYFKRPLPKSLIPLQHLLVGAPQELLRRGFFGHVAGKTVYRLPLVYRQVTVHGPRDGLAGRHVTGRGVSVLHFDHSDYESWRQKWELRHRTPSKFARTTRQRQAQRDMISRSFAGGESGLWALYRRIYVLDAWRFALLRSLGLVRRISLHRRLMAAER